MNDPWYIRQFDTDSRSEQHSSYRAVTNEPPASWRPFSATSPWNTPVPASPTISTNSTQMVAWLNSLKAGGGPVDRYIGNAGTTGDYDRPIYYSSASDPLVRIRLAAGQRDPSTTSLGQASSKSLQYRLIHMPSNALAAQGDDAHMTIVSQNKCYDMWQAQKWNLGSGVVSMGCGSVFDLSGEGVASASFAATAAGLPLYGGTIRLCELQAGLIDHAIAISVKYVRKNNYVYPAGGFALGDPAVVSGDVNDMQRPPTGGRMQLNMTHAEIDALGMPLWKTTILKAMSTYGMIIVDTSGGGSFSIFCESAQPDLQAGQPDRWRTFGQSQGWTLDLGNYVMPLSAGVDWTKLRFVDMP